MKSRQILLMLLVIGFSQLVVVGGISVWYTALPLTPNASIDNQGLGMPLDLRCDMTTGDCSWRITAQLKVNGGTSTTYGIFLRHPTGTAGGLSTSQTSIVGSPYSNLIGLVENGSNGIIHRIDAASPVAIPGSKPTITHFMYSFTLTKAAQGFSSVDSLDIGVQCFGGIEPTDPFDPCRDTSVNGSPASQGGFYYTGFDLFTITNVPEPTSLSLLVCGLVLVGRRRWQW